MKWGIAYKPDPGNKVTMSGRMLARPEMFATKEQADAFLVAQGQDDFLYAVETDGVPKPTFPDKVPA